MFFRVLVKGDQLLLEVGVIRSRRQARCTASAFLPRDQRSRNLFQQSNLLTSDIGVRTATA